MSEEPGRISPYRVLSQVGEGSMGIVYKAHDERLDRVVALKVVREPGSNDDLRNRFLQEARTARHLSYLRLEDDALDMLSRSVGGGFFCYPAMLRDPWLDPLRSHPEFTAIMRKCQQLHREASAAFLKLGGGALLGLPAENY